MNVDKSLRILVITLVALFVGLWLFAASFDGGGSYVGLAVTMVVYIFVWLAVPLCAIGALIGLIAKQGVKVGLFYGLSGALGLTVMLIFWVVFLR